MQFWGLRRRRLNAREQRQIVDQLLNICKFAARAGHLHNKRFTARAPQGQRGPGKLKT